MQSATPISPQLVHGLATTALPLTFPHISSYTYYASDVPTRISPQTASDDSSTISISPH